MADDKERDVTTIAVSNETHRKLKIRAAKKGKTVKEITEELLKKGGLDENDD